MNWSFIPPADLLERGEAIERGLRQYQKLGRFGWSLGAIALVIQFTLLLMPNLERIVPSVGTIPWHGSWAALLGNPAVGLVLLAIIVGGLLIPVMLRLRLREAQQPFRYTCSIDPFTSAPASVTDAKLEWLSHDLAQKLGERVGRLKFVDANEVRNRKSDFKESHIHISGAYFIRQRNEVEERQRWFVEAMPRVRVGSMEAPDTLAHPVNYPLESEDGEAKESGGKLNLRDYDRLLERVYFSVVSELYGQIREDVERKVDLLPTAYLRAIALYHEASDYARSSTLNGYEDAADLFDRSARSLDVSLRQPPTSRPRRWLFGLRRRVVGLWRWLKLCLAAVVPLFGKPEILFIRARNGYARMLLYRRSLAEMSGSRVNPIFEARFVADAAASRLKPVLHDVPGYEDCHFDVLVTQALTLALLADPRSARKKLDEARSYDPKKADNDPVYLYARGKSEASPATRHENLQRSIDLADRFHVARFDLAEAIELEWRRCGTLDPTTAEYVTTRYVDVVAINPTNLRAWANLGYLNWLLWRGKGKSYSNSNARETDCLTRAREAYESGLEYKEIARNILVSELRFGLARIEAEAGHFDRAFRHLQDAMPEKLAQGMSHNARDYTENYFVAMTDEMMERFTAYRSRVLPNSKQKRRKADAASIALDHVCAFVENDYGAACYNFYLRTGDEKYLGKAVLACRRAVRLDSRFVLAHFSLHRICQELRSRDARRGCRGKGRWPSARWLRRVQELAPDWLDGKLIRMEQLFSEFRDHQREARRLHKQLEDRRKKLEKIKNDLKIVDQQLEELSRKDESQPKGQATTAVETAVRTGVQDAGAPDSAPGDHVPAKVNDPTSRRALAATKTKLEGTLKIEERQNKEAADDEEKWLKKALNEWDEAWDIFGSIVPHEWLYSIRGQRMNTSDVARNLIEHFSPGKNEVKEAGGEREEFNDVHVLALIRLARCLADDYLYTPPRAEHDGYQISRPDPISLPDLIHLLMLIRERFYPRNIELLEIVVYALKDEKDENVGHLNKEKWRDDLLAVLVEALTEEPFYFAAMTWLDTDVLTKEAMERSAEGTILIDLLNRVANAFGSQKPHTASPLHDSDGFRRELIFAVWKIKSFDLALAQLKVMALGRAISEVVSEIYRRYPETYELLRQFLEGCTKECISEDDESRWSNLQSAAFALDRAKLAHLGDTLEPDTTLIGEAPTLWVHPSAFGPGFNAEENFRQSFHTVFVRLMEEIKAEHCLFVDAIKEPKLVLHKQWEKNGYIIDVSGLLSPGVVEPAGRFCPSPNEFQRATQILPYVFNPASGALDGVWIKDRNLAARLGQHGVELWPAEEYICRHLFFELRKSLSDFVGYERVKRLLRGLSRSADADLRISAEQLMGASSSALERMTAFARLLKRLAQERVPIENMELPLRTFKREWRPGCDLLSVSEKIRWLEKARLPGIKIATPIRLSESCLKNLDDYVRAQHQAGDQSPPLAIPRPLANQLIGDIRANLPTADKCPCSIVVSQDHLRPYVAGVVEAHFSGVAVLASRELRDGSRRASAAPGNNRQKGPRILAKQS